ncbi:MAG: hypothetical protein M3N82_16075 [Pseudomonadota bacterium]|nr:hypothetical protein [Pseudomonadota bacterium]
MNDRHDPIPIPASRTRAPASRARLGVALAALVVASTGCSTMPNTAPRYVEPPATVGSAKVRVVNTHPFAYYADIAVFDSPTCFTKANLGMTGGNSHDAERIGMLDARPVSAATLERSVRADEALVIGPRAVFPTVTSDEIMRSLMPQTQNEVRARQAGVCKLPSFVPKAGEQYEVVVDLAPARCTVTPYRLVGDDGAVRREPVETQAARISTYEFDMKCFK